jgi:hypothetical protein
MSPGHDHAGGPTGPGSVVLELGGDVGVLVLHAPAWLRGREIEISPAPGDGGKAPRTHALVRERRTVSAVSYAAVYAEVQAGRYTVWREADAPVGTVTVAGGQVAHFHWPG